MSARTVAAVAPRSKASAYKERFERRAGLPRARHHIHLSSGIGPEVRRPHPGEDFSTPVVEHDRRGLLYPPVGELIHGMADLALQRLLQPDVQGSPPCSREGPTFLLRPKQQVTGEMGGEKGPLPVSPEQRLVPGAVDLVPGSVPLPGERRESQRPPFGRASRSDEGILPRRSPRQPASRAACPRLTCSAEAPKYSFIPAATPTAPCPSGTRLRYCSRICDLVRWASSRSAQHGLDQLLERAAADRAEQPGQLHGDGGCARYDPPVHQIVPERPRHRARVDPVMLEEPAILQCDEGTWQIRVHAFQRLPGVERPVTGSGGAERHAIPVLDGEALRPARSEQRIGQRPPDPSGEREDGCRQCAGEPPSAEPRRAAHF